MKKNLMKKPVLLLAAAIVLLLASTVGSTQAALTYYSENFSAEVTVSNIGVTLLENGNVVDYRNYLENGQWDTKGSDVQKLTLLTEGEKLIPGKSYDEALSVKNSGAIDTYVRLIITKSWQDADGKDATLSPAYIGLNTVTGENGWVIDEAASVNEASGKYYERTVLYYTDILKVGAATPVCTDIFRIDPVVAKELTQHTENNIITYEYKYDGYQCVVEVEVDAVQTHNAADAIKSAWGIDVNVAANGKISLK